MKRRLLLLWTGFKKMNATIDHLLKGQKPEYALLQNAHRLEKGLTINDPRPLWGWGKAYAMVKLLNKCDDEFACTTAKAVLNSYLIAKNKSDQPEEKVVLNDFLQKSGLYIVENEGYVLGGVKTIKPYVFNKDEENVISKLFNTRHSAREFSDKHVPNEVLNHAVELALRCPSACNRQPFKVYAYDPNNFEAFRGKKLQYQGNKVLIITGDIRAFTIGEMNDWIVSPSIFAAYLTLSLHALGVGSCVVRKDLFGKNDYNDAIRRFTGMDESEEIILEMFIGYYKDEFVVPVSNRAKTSDIIKYV